MEFKDESDPTKELIDEIEEKCAVGHWKAAARRLKKLSRRFPDADVPESTYVKVLDACLDNRLHGARASEPARKILEQFVEKGLIIPEQQGNLCIQNCLGTSGPHSTHQGFGGLDTALAMTAALEQTGTPISPETNEKLCLALAKEGSIEQALSLLRKIVVDQSYTPPLSTFAVFANSEIICNKQDHKHGEDILTVLAYAKAAGYELDTVASLPDGRSLLASGVIAAEWLDNTALGLRLLKAAASAQGVAPDRGDVMVALSSPAAQRACTLIHKRAIIKAVEDGEWQLAVKILELMLQRSLRPSPWVWRNVVTCCAKAEKSRKATALLFDWLKYAERGNIEKPPLSVFNTVVNVCEICGEEDLTIDVLDAMQRTHETEGNLITLNIALKRLAKLGNFQGCEGMIIGMLQSNVEPSVVSYTTAIAACAKEGNKQPTVAYEWLKRMRSRNVQPNVITYNTALAACLDGKLESTFLASKIATEMLTDVDRQLQKSDEEFDEYTNVVPDSATKTVARKLMQQLKQNWIDGHIDKKIATETTRVPLLMLVDFQKSEAAEEARKRAASRRSEDEDQAKSTRRLEIEVESMAHRVAEV
jgi:pentatricopeptide repeat protein